MSIRLDPRRVGVLKRLAGETGMRPGDLVRQWVEERLDAARQGIDTPDAAKQLSAQLDELAARVAALEGAAGVASPTDAVIEPPRETDQPATVADEPTVTASSDEDRGQDDVDEQPEAATAVATVPSDDAAADATDPPPTEEGPKRSRRVTAAPSGPRVALHDEMIAVISERGPMTAGDLASAVAERGRYQPPRSGKPLDAAMVSQRVSNPVYRARFTRNEGRIGLGEAAE